MEKFEGIQLGIYQHYEHGDYYYVDSLPGVGKRGKLKDTIIVTYFRLDPGPGEAVKYHTEYAEFVGSIEYNNQTVKRFRYIGVVMPTEV